MIRRELPEECPDNQCILKDNQLFYHIDSDLNNYLDDRLSDYPLKPFVIKFREYEVFISSTPLRGVYNIIVGREIILDGKEIKIYRKVYNELN